MHRCNPIFTLVCGSFVVALSLGCRKSDVPTPAATITQVVLPDNDALRDRIDRALDFTAAKRHLNSKDHAAWQVVHGVLSYGKDFQISHNGQLVPALDYLLQGGALTGWNMRKGDHGLEAVLEAGSKTGQGHEDQWLGYLSQCNLPTSEPITVAGQNYTINDLITQAQWDIYPGMEATWTLMAFSTYLPLDARWTSKNGNQWTLERVVDMEARQDLNESACGGTHRLYGLTVAMNRYQREGGAITGGWAEADKVIRNAVAKAQEYQQPDGSFSTMYFQRSSSNSDLSERIGATGHTAEFLSVALGDEELRQPWVTRAIVYVLGMLEATQDKDLECGKLYHATHGLLLYRQRRFGDRSAVAESAGSPAATTAGTAEPDAKDSAAQ